MKALPITYIVRAANVNDKVLVKPLLRKASRLLRCKPKTNYSTLMRVDLFKATC